MKEALQSLLRSWAQGARKVGFLVLLLVGSAAAGIAVAWPLWFFATSARRLYTACVLCLAAVGVVFVVIRAIVRARMTARDISRSRRSPLAWLAAVLQAAVFLGGLYIVAVLISHGLWLFAIPLLFVWLGLLVLLGLARRSGKAWRGGGIVPKIRKE